MIVGNPVSNPDFLTPGIAAFTPGSPGVIQGLAVFIATQLSTADEPIEKVAVVYGDNDGAKTAVDRPVHPGAEPARHHRHQGGSGLGHGHRTRSPGRAPGGRARPTPTSWCPS